MGYDIKFKDLPKKRKKLYLNLLGYFIDKEGFIVDKNKVRVKCRYTGEYVPFEIASILPGTTVIIKTSAYTLSSYISEKLSEDEADGGY